MTMSSVRLLRSLIILPLLLWVNDTHVSAAPIEIERVIAELQPQTTLPIWMPDEVPGLEQVYISLYTTSGLYSIYFDLTPDCGGATYCNYGSFTAEQDGQFWTPDDLGPRDEIAFIRFENGMSGQFVNTCGPYCTAKVQWRLGGILYNATIKNGTQAATVDLANNILQGDVRAQGTAQ
ncbi:MAG: hypothetical protein AAFQ89_03100 [Cyanobacteria bacterium J06626_18]